MEEVEARKEPEEEDRVADFNSKQDKVLARKSQSLKPHCCCHTADNTRSNVHRLNRFPKELYIRM